MGEPTMRSMSQASRACAWLPAAPLALAILISGVAASAAQDYPAKPIRVILPNAPGSNTDFAARLVTSQMTAKLGQPFVVENISGAAGIPGTTQLVRAPKDGYTIGFVTSNHAMNAGLYQLPYDTVKDLTPISVVTNAAMVLLVNAKTDIKDVNGLIAYAKANPGRLNYGSTGVGTAAHFAAVMFGTSVGIDWLHVPYKSNDRYVTDLTGGHIETGFLPTATAVPQVKAGRLRALAVMTPQRAKSMPEVPSFKELGISVGSIDAWVAMVAPSGIPTPIVERLQTAAQEALKTQVVQDRLPSQGVEAVGTDARGALAIFEEDVAKYLKLVKDNNIQPEQ
jgi:tripartite-type tricarboxylate transporter receptor subunit TctC